MGVVRIDDPTDEDAPAVRVVQPRPLPGVPGRTLSRYLLENAITRNTLNEQRGGFVEDFQTTFPIDCIIRPLARESPTDSATTSPVLQFERTISGVAEEVIVIRSLTWLIGFAATATPDSVSVLLDTAETDGQIEHFRAEAPFVGSGRVIGDAASPLSLLFRQLLPLALLPGDRLIFRQNIGVAAALGSQVSRFQERSQLPFRPAGL